MKLLLAISLAIAAAGVSFSDDAFATDVIVKRRGTLREDPSTQKPPVAILDEGEDVELMEPGQTNGYYHVRTREGEEGYVYGGNAQPVAPPAVALARPARTVRPAGRPPDTGIVSTIPPDWDKPQPNVTRFEGPDGECGPTGSGGGTHPIDTLTNARKNRTDTAGEYHAVTWAALQALPYPQPAPTSMMNWTAAQRAIIEPYQGIAVSVVGYLAAVKVEDRGSGESTNCHFTNREEVDWHMPLVEQSRDPESTSIVVEATPRVRKSHPKWTPTALAPWVKSSAPVRISGWVLLDPDHPGHLGTYRSTLFEVHPVMQIDVWQDGQWIDLDELP